MNINLIVLTLVALILLANTVGAIITVFHKPRSIITTLAWLIVLFLLPVIGFIIYAFLGRGLDQDNLFSITSQNHVGLESLTSIIKNNNLSNTNTGSPRDDTSKNATKIIQFFNIAEDAPLTRHNEVKIYTDGKEKFEGLFNDIKNAKESIHIEYYSIFNDEIGNKLMTLLDQKAQEGLKVKVLYDPWGSSKTTGMWFKKYEHHGIEVLPFVTGRNVIAKTRLNYHLHRKIVVIDGIVGWIGGFNVGDQYLNITRKFGYWRDTHIRIYGSAALSMQERFFLDWNASITKKTQLLKYDNRYFPTEKIPYNKHTRIQIVADGPDTNDENLKNGFISMILNAKKSIYLQTPYLVPDDSVMTALQIASKSGVDIHIMIPDKPDHAFIYRATQYYANFLTNYGIKVYTYNNGFLHAKTAIFDDKIASVGSMNHDFRSYGLNFEANAFIYNSDIANELKNIFKADVANSTLITTEIIAKQGRWLKFKQYFSRLLSPIL